MNVIINNEENLDEATFSIRPLYFWKDYILEREKIENENYNYQDFIKNNGGSYRTYTR